MGTAPDDLGKPQGRTPVRAVTRPTTGSTSAEPRTGEPRTAEPRPSADPRPSGQRTSSSQPRAAVPAPTPAPVPAVAAPVERRYRQTVHRVDLWTVLKMSVCFYLCTMAVAMIAIVALWAIGDAVGVISSVEKFLG
ncbi:MAG: DUF3566 domain-containing protein, partial [Acidimicrobiia bacterium]